MMCYCEPLLTQHYDTAVSDTKYWIVKHSFDLRHHAGMLAHPCLGRYR